MRIRMDGTDRLNQYLNAPNVIEGRSRCCVDVKEILGASSFEGVRVSCSSGVGLYSLATEWK